MMTIKRIMVPAVLLAIALPCGAGEKRTDKHKKKGAQRGMLERMEAVPCGAKQRGFTGLGSIFASAGIEAVNSEEKLCAQYLLRTDEMEYHIRPVDKKHAVLLPVGEEGEFKIKKNRMYLKVPDGDKKNRSYEVVSMKPLNSGDGSVEGAAYRSTDRPATYHAPERPVEKAAGGAVNPNPPVAPQ
jgi:hypothetical protein